eukprot:CAMPEP_0175040972 /NCGR_PEP_ID=MMETSP0052_2-20121109/1622_1 /TAXON_ID=51329 ORGANISM="Polytomella parva, Strain SAG 63-3" /NCGR_SAMPLE_ID=MMETSP0052_2 /ASSEMBLY_ACC=CAM_ASM_000194 /LENGTH=248 /DNA_ID=CAMNT_0016303367 /DNA_START=151 /DNA_END=894 /DNA_ORIENTATION=+
MEALLGRRQKVELKPVNCLGRYVVTKHNQWRGKYRRVLCITTSAILTQNPEQQFAITNTYAFVGDSDIESITLGPGNDEEGEFVITARQDKKSKFKPNRFTCRYRSRLLTDLYQALTAAATIGACSIAQKIVGLSDTFPALTWAEGAWVVISIRLSSRGIEVVAPSTGSSSWRIDFTQLATTAFAPLQSESSSATAAALSVLDGGVSTSFHPSLSGAASSSLAASYSTASMSPSRMPINHHHHHPTHP